LTAAVIFGGVNIRPQIDRLRRGVDVLVATPGRLLDHAERKTIDLSKVEILVLDEADRMLDMGFIHDIRKILALLPEDPQTLLFSATFSDGIKELADSLLDSPARIEVDARNTTVEGVSQVIHPVDRPRKRSLLSFLIKSKGWKKVLVFTRTKRGASRLSQHLERGGIRATAIHSDKSQRERTRALADFKRGAVRVLVATDIASRGLDIDELPYVVNFEMPHIPEDYVHRIGRTARAGNQGDAISLVCVDEDKQLKDVERLLNRDIPKVLISGYEPDRSLEAGPIMNRRTPSRPVRALSGRNDTHWRSRRAGRRMRRRDLMASPDSYNKEHSSEGRIGGNGRRAAKAQVRRPNRRKNGG
jgi:ATP-dependent RNA helicase RhlE